MKKKIFAMVTAAAMVTSLFGACVTSLADAPEVNGKITFWTVGDKSNPDDQTYQWMEETISLFEEKYPDCQVEVTYVPSGQDYLTKITTEVAAGNAPDVFRTYLTGRLQPFVDGGNVLSIEHMLETYPETKAIMNEKALALATFDDVTYAIPLIASGELIFYNKQIFADCGVEVPATYDEFLAAIDTFNENGVTPVMLGISDPWPGTIPYMMIFNRLNGNDLYESVILDKQADFANEAFVKAGEYLQELVERNAFNESCIAISSEEACSNFRNGEAAMIFDGSWSVASYARELGENVGAFNLPMIEGGAGSDKDCLMNFDEGYAISSKTQNQDAAEAFLAFLYSPERQAAYAELGNIIACQNVDYNTSKNSTLLNEVCEIFENAEYSIIPWDNPLGTDVGQELNNTTQAIIMGEDVTESFEILQDYALDAWE